MDHMEQEFHVVFLFILHTQHLRLSPEALEKVFHIQIELGYGNVRIRYRYPLGAGLGRGNEKEMLEAEPIERSLNDMDRESIQPIYQIALHLTKNLC
jgi:hypothetical protein